MWICKPTYLYRQPPSESHYSQDIPIPYSNMALGLSRIVKLAYMHVLNAGEPLWEVMT